MARRFSTFVSIGFLALLVGCGGGGGGGPPPPPPPPAADTAPNAFAFTAQSATERTAVVPSNEVVVSGINSGAAVSITGGEYSIDGGAYTSAAGTVNNNQRIRVRVTSSGQFVTAVSAVLTIGGVSGTFTATTRNADTTPNAFQFQRKADATRDAWVSSAGATIADIEVPVPVSVESGEYSIDGGSFTSAAGTISSGQTLMVRVRAGSSYSRVTRGRVTVGGVPAEFEVVAELPAYLPDAIAYDGQDLVYLLSATNRMVFRWSLAASGYIDPLTVGNASTAPAKMTHSSAHNRLYLGYASGAIRYINVAGTNAAEVDFATATSGITALSTAGNFLLANAGTGYIYSSAGAITEQGWAYYYGYSNDYAWDPVSARVYYFRDGLSPNDLHFSVINQTSGTVTSSDETPYHGSYSIQYPIRVSVNGQRVLLGSGDIYGQNGLNWEGSLGGQVTDARWFADGSLVALTTSGNQTTLRRLGTNNLVTQEQLSYTGAALRIVGTDTKMAVLVNDGGALRIRSYVPNDDGDGDGAANTQDAFPLDGAASVDTDRDGYPDAWNAGRTQADSTTGLSLDAFPQDAACWLTAHGSGSACNYGATIPSYLPDRVVQDGDVVYLLSTANKRVYRWSISAGAYLNPYVVGINQGFSTLSPTHMAYSAAHQRVYLGYSNGAIRTIDVTSGNAAETPFANVATAVGGLASAGNYVLAQDFSGAWATHYIISSAGVITDQREWNYYSREYAWDATKSRVYFFRDDTSPNDLHYEVIDQATGKITAAGETQYHGDYGIQPPIRVSGNGQYVLLGSGDIYNSADSSNQNRVTWSGSVGSQVADARWLANSQVVTLATSGNQTTLRRLSSTNLGTLEQLTFAGEALRVVGSDTAMVVLVNNGGTVQYHRYVPNDDSDGDGVVNTSDAFPLDPAASVDSDHDGHPNAWNVGRSQADSTTGLTLDAFPNDAACWLTAHGSGGNCNYGATIPAYIPDKVVSAGDVIYLLSAANKRVYRWSMATGRYLDPYIVGINQGFSSLAPTHMAYSAAHQRLYFGYSSGAIRYLDVTAGTPVETPFTNVATPVGGLASVGNYLLAQDYSGAWATHYVINSAGVITDQAEWNYYSPDYAWDPVSSRVYFFRDGSPGDLHYEEINQSTGEIASQGESPYHDSTGWSVPIRVSPDGNHVLVGSGRIVNRDGLTIAGHLGGPFADAHWATDVLVDVTTGNEVEIRDPATRAVLDSYQYNGTPLRLAFGQSEAYLVHVAAGASTTSFVRLPFYDQDGDDLPRWWEQLYGLSDSNAADAAGDADGDGVRNEDEYANRTDPQDPDTDGDGLDDPDEIVTHGTSPTRADTDGDGLTDHAEVVTYNCDPLDTDSDNDTYNDFDEVLYGGNPNNGSVLPQALSSYTQTFEGSPNLAAWSNPPQSGAPWSLDATTAHGGTSSYKSGSSLGGQSTSTRFRGVFRAGQLTFWAHVEGYCCSPLTVYVDGSAAATVYANYSSQWVSYTIPVPAGAHGIEWRFTPETYSGAGAVGRIDDVVFTAN